MKEFAACIASICFIIFIGANVEASWLLDAERFHVSAHGQTSCQDCHADIADKTLHPDPAEVNKTLPDFYQLEQCTACHEDVLEDVHEGTHGGEKITDEQEFTFCIGCHDPHYQLSYIDSAAKLDLTQPVEKKCSTCHDLQKELPEFSSEDEQCMSCHRSVTSGDPTATEYISKLCFHCHGKSEATKKSGSFARIDEAAYSTTDHADTSCITCHLEAVEFQHANQELGDCRQCHNLHDEKVAHNAHFRVSCEACHLNHISPVKEAGSGQILWHIDRRLDDISAIHTMVNSNDDAFCQRCHFGGNTIGAVAMVLPAKSVICMPCHVATFSVRDTTTLIALIIFGLGVLGAGSIWFSGSLVGVAGSGAGGKLLKSIQAILAVIPSSRIFSIVKVLILDGLLQRRLFRISRYRWFIHALIFFPFLIRFCWGFIALVASIQLPEWQGIWIMLDKNHPLSAFLFDLLGVLVILGVVLIIIRKRTGRSENIPEGLPRTDWLAFSLLGGIIIVGFILEGMRIAMTDTPDGSRYAFLGYTISRLFTGVNLTGIYGYLWYVHAIFTGAFVAYLPFSRMFHMIMAPVSLAMNVGAKHSRQVISHG